MPRKPKIATFTNSSVDVLNAIRNSASINYQNYVPIATADADSIKAIGTIIMDMPELQNEFIQNLINRIGRVYVTSKMYQNPLALFKRGYMEFGESIEEIFVGLAKPFQYDPAVAEETLFKREKPNVQSAFHIMNFQKYYKITIEEKELRKAFLSWTGVYDLITRKVDSLYTSASYDEFLVMKYMVGLHILRGEVFPVEIPSVSSANMKEIASVIRGTSNDMEFMSTKYNRAGVHTYSDKRSQYIILNSIFDAKMDVEVLASAFNMSRAEFLGNRVLVDSFGGLDFDRLDVLFDNDPNYFRFTAAQIQTLDAVPAVLVDRDYFMVLDTLNEMRDTPNGEGLYRNYCWHQWKVFSVSPFANAVLFAPGTPSVTSVTVTPSSATVTAGNAVQLEAAATVSNFAPVAVNWTSSDENVTVSPSGVVTVGQNAAAGNVTITATSVYDDSVRGTATITVSRSGLVTSVTVSPATATVDKGETQQMSATVATAKPWVPNTVTWSSSNAKVTISDTGLATVAADATGTATITATSTYDSSVSSTATITVGS